MGKNNSELIIYETKDGNVKLDVNLENETVWLSANQMSLIFNRDEKVIRKHINNVFNEGELDRENNTQKMRVDYGVKNFSGGKYFYKKFQQIISN